jgi:hypothetical protein
MEGNPTLICITPMKNEDWILRRFLSATSLWADHIILYDQNSTDQSPEIAKEFEKVHYCLNPSVEFNDYNHWSGLLNEARNLPGGRKVIFSMDCDEFFSGNTFSSAEWRSFIQAKSGSLMVVERYLVSGDFQKYKYEMDCLMGFVDDGFSTISMLAEKKHVHNIRLPYPQGNPIVYKMNRIRLLHYSLLDIDRLRSKNRWYQCFELTIKDKSRMTILDQYFFDKDKLLAIHNSIPSSEEWFGYYERAGIDMTSQQKRSIYYWWDKKILEEYFPKYGMAYFARLHIWDIDWERAAAHFEIPFEQKIYSRSLMDKIYLQLFLQSKKSKSALIRGLSGFLVKFL